jgi:hypothetical protein
MILRLLPIVLADLLFAAHVLRFHGLWPAVIVFLINFTLLIRKPWIPIMWQLLTGLAIIEWMRITIYFVNFRMAMDMPYVRLLIIMGLVILYNVFIIFRLRSYRIQKWYLGED